MLIGGIALGLILGLLAGGSLLNLGTIRLRRIGLLAVALALRVATELLLNAHVALADALRVPLFATSFGLLLAALWVNRRFPGMSLAFVGILLNTIAIRPGDLDHDAQGHDGDVDSQSVRPANVLAISWKTPV